MTDIIVKAYQFLSRRQLPIGIIRFPAKRLGTQMTFNCSIINKPFDISFASISGRNPTIGASEYVDLQDHYADSRWPTCVFAEVEVDTEEDTGSIDVLYDLMLGIRDVLHIRLSDNPLFQASDHISKRPGYRRSYASAPSLDIVGTRRPNSSEHYHPTKAGEFLGPGLVSVDHGNSTTEFVWSQIIPFPGVTSIAVDISKLRKIISDMQLHFNGYNELIAARKHLRSAESSGEFYDIKAAVRAAASGIEPLLKFYCKLHSTKWPRSGSLSFDQKIEEILRNTGMPLYGTVSPQNLESIGKLYKARNSMHTGGCYLKDADGAHVDVDCALAQQFIDAAEQFAVWLDSLA